MANSPDSELSPDEMYCSECGSVIERDVAFCPGCGTQYEPPPNSNTEQNSAGEDLPLWHDDGVLSRYVKFWGDKHFIYQLIDLGMLVGSAGFFVGWIGMEAVLIHDKKQDWDGASKYYADIEEGELVG